MLNETEKHLVSLIDKDELVELTRDLVRIDSVIRPESENTEKEVVAYISRWIKNELGMEPVIDEVLPERENIFLEIDTGKVGPVLMFEGIQMLSPKGCGNYGSMIPSVRK